MVNKTKENKFLEGIKLTNKNFKYIIKCPFCNEKKYKLYILLDKQHGIYLKKCKNCNALYYNKHFTDKILIENYVGYNPPYVAPKNPTLPYKILYFFNRDHLYYPELNNPGTITDVGGGNGKYIFKYKNLGWNVHGLDIDKNMIKKLQERGISAEVFNLLKDNPSKLLINSSDIIICYFVLEHMSEMSLFNSISPILKKKGRLFIIIPNESSIFAKIFKKYYYMWFFGQHIVFPSKKSLILCLEKYGYIFKSKKYIPEMVELVGSIDFYLKKDVLHPDTNPVRNKIVIRLLNIFILPIFWILALLGLAGNVRYEFIKK